MASVRRNNRAEGEEQTAGAGREGCRSDVGRVAHGHLLLDIVAKLDLDRVVHFEGKVDIVGLALVADLELLQRQSKRQISGHGKEQRIQDTGTDLRWHF